MFSFTRGQSRHHLWLAGLAVLLLLTLAVTNHRRLPVASALTPTPSRTASGGLPDLVVSNISWVPIYGGACVPQYANRMVVGVQNLGTGNAGPFAISLKLSYSATPEVQQVSGLAAGQGVTIQFNMGFAQMGQYTAIVDVNAQVSESNETNNQRTMTMPAVSATPAGGTPRPTCTSGPTNTPTATGTMPMATYTRTPTTGTPTRSPTRTYTRTRTRTYTSGTSYPAWTAWTSYATGARVSYGGASYQCIQGHTSQPGWEPPNVPALWQRL